MLTEEIIYVAIMFSVTMVFTLVSLSNQKEVHFKWFAAICWFIFSVVTFLAGSKDLVYALGLGLLWLGIGLVFTVWGFSSFFEAKKEKRGDFDRW